MLTVSPVPPLRLARMTLLSVTLWVPSLPLSPVAIVIAPAVPVDTVPVPPSASIPATEIDPSAVLISTVPAAPPVAAPPSIPLVSILPLSTMLPAPVTSRSTLPDVLPDVAEAVVILRELARVIPLAALRSMLPLPVVIELSRSMTSVVRFRLPIRES